jgi:hypothetical protein
MDREAGGGGRSTAGDTAVCGSLLDGTGDEEDDDEDEEDDDDEDDDDDDDDAAACWSSFPLW